PEVQVRLLRVLQEKEIERVGGFEPIRVDIRVIAATHRDLAAMISEGKFRDDLYYRLNVFPIVLPPLRERREDIPSLTHYFIQRKSREIGIREMPSLAQGALESLMAYPWPGNVRELENAVERALILSRGEPITFEDLQASKSGGVTMGLVRVPPLKQEDALALDEVVSLHIRRVLEMTEGRVGGKNGAAKFLQINPSTLRKRMRKLGIPFGRKAKSVDS
ncbi:MAG: sigma-54-dependent Fis family transcriptional regulator, partial [Deltaproteobacteria bacterium]|nr:sigma-54-dependent Fis family transcriptional regulator [Deltaproteobacteria bacterium]